MQRLRLASWALLLAASALTLAAEQRYDFTVCTSGKRVPLEASADLVAFGIENWGVVASSTTPLFEQAGTHCVGHLRIVAGRPLGKGLCKWALVGGDTGIGEWEYPATGEPRWTWLAGTGRLRGVQGGGSFRELFSAPAVDPATSLGCRRDWGTLVLP